MNPEVSTQLKAGSQADQVGYSEAKDAFQRNSDWWSVFASFDLPDFTPSPIWISRKTGVPIEDVVEALEGLSVLGYLKKDKGAFYPVKDKPFFSFDWTNKTKSDVIEEHAVVSQQILNHMHDQTTIAFDHRFLAANKDIITELYRDIKRAFDKALDAANEQKARNDGIYKITFTGVDIVKRDSRDNGGRA